MQIVERDGVNVDGVLGCQINCTLTVTLAVSAVVDGRGRITATPAGAIGSVLFSINGFQTPGLPPDAGSTAHIFDNLPPGTYTVSVRETRTAGCSAPLTPSALGAGRDIPADLGSFAHVSTCRRSRAAR